MTEMTEVVDRDGNILWATSWREANFVEYVPALYLNRWSTGDATIRVVER